MCTLYSNQVELGTEAKSPSKLSLYESLSKLEILILMDEINLE